jgi:hypothetical protein
MTDAGAGTPDRLAWLRHSIEYIARQEEQAQAMVAAIEIDLERMRADKAQLTAELQRYDAKAPAYAAPGPGLGVVPGFDSTTVADATRPYEARSGYPTPGQPTPGQPAPGYPTPPSFPTPPSDPRQPETSTHAVQNVLFVLGGLLLGTAAIAFTAVAWATFGQAGRAAVLGTVTLIMLGVPLLALARDLRATAETFAAVGLLLVVLDGYALWYIDVAGVQSMSGERYAGLVALVTAVIGLGYRLTTRLAGPGFAAVLAAQPVLILLIQPDQPWTISLVCSAAAALDVAIIGWIASTASEHRRNEERSERGDEEFIIASTAQPGMLVVRRRRDPRPLRTVLTVLTWVVFGLWLASAFVNAANAQTSPIGPSPDVADRVRAGLALVVFALVLLAGSLVERKTAFVNIAEFTVVLATAIALGYLVATAQPGHGLLLVAAIAALISLAVAAVVLVLPIRMRIGLRVGATVVAGVVWLGVAVEAVLAAAITVSRAFPVWAGKLGPTGPNSLVGSWEVPASALLVALALAVVARPRMRVALAVLGGLLAILALPASVALPWWAPAPIALAAAAAALGVALAGRTVRATVGAALSGGVLTLFAVLTSLTRPGLTAGVLAGLVVVGVGLSALAARRPQGGTDRLVVGGLALAVALVAVVPMIGSALVAAGVADRWAARAAVTGLVFVIGAVAVVTRLSRREGVWPGLPRYAFAGLAVAAMAEPLIASAAADEPVVIYAAVSLLVIALGLVAGTLPAGRAPTGGLAAAAVALAAPPGVALIVGVVPPILALVGGPYSWAGAVWSGTPAGVGLGPVGGITIRTPVLADAAAVAIVAITSATIHYGLTRRWTTALAGLAVGGPTAILLGITASGAPWPSVPAATLLCGLLLLVLAATVAAQPARTAIGATQGILYIGAGLAGALPARWSTLAALGIILVGAAIIGAVGRDEGWRVFGWIGAVVAALTLAAAGGFAADLPAQQVAFGVLGAAIVALFTDAVVGHGLGRPVEARAIHAAAQAGGLVALLFTVGFTGYASAISVIWGLAIGLRAIAPGTSGPARVRMAAVGGAYELLAWWLLLASNQVTLVEAYTLPLALLALLAGWAALRVRPELRSWVAFGPALAAGFLPSLAEIIGVDGSPWRRLALGAAAVIVVVIGSVGRRQAPVVVGGIVLVVVALHELVLLWQLLPGWVPLAIGGVILVGLAITYERRLRDLRRLRSALGRMS